MSARPHFWLQLVSVVVSVIVGVLLSRHRGAGLLLLLVYFLVEGISKVIFSLTIRPFPNWGWVLASGVVTILVAFYLWASLPITAIWPLSVLLGIQLICEGAVGLAGADKLTPLAGCSQRISTGWCRNGKFAL